MGKNKKRARRKNPDNTLWRPSKNDVFDSSDEDIEAELSNPKRKKLNTKTPIFHDKENENPENTFVVTRSKAKEKQLQKEVIEIPSSPERRSNELETVREEEEEEEIQPISETQLSIVNLDTTYANPTTDSEEQDENTKEDTTEDASVEVRQSENAKGFRQFFKNLLPTWFSSNSSPIQQTQPPQTQHSLSPPIFRVPLQPVQPKTSNQIVQKEHYNSVLTTDFQPNGSKGASESALPTEIVAASPQIDDEDIYYRSFNIPFSELKLEQQVSSGAFGDVYRARWRGSKVAVKLFKTNSVKTLPMFRKEASLLAKLRHPNICLYMGHTLSNTNKTGIVMNFAEKGSLYDVLHKSKEKLDNKVILKMVKQTAQGLNYLHLSTPIIIHRDLKTQNILVDNSLNLQIADFGISRQIDKTMTGYTGTVAYMAPEVISGRGHYTEKVDVFSYAVICWELFTGEIPWKDMMPIQIAYRISQGERLPVPSSLPPPIAKLLSKCWLQNSERRPSFSDILLFLANNFAELRDD